MKEIGNIANLFFTASELYPDSTAIIHGKKSITYSDLLNEVRSTSAYFERTGIQKGDRVLVFVPMSIDLYRIVLALFSMGAVAVFLDEWVSKKRMEECCRIAQCKGFIGIAKARLLIFFSAELKKIPVKLSLSTKVEKNSSIQAQVRSCSLADPALITFTTGSTGIPKAAKRTHGFLKEQFEALKEKIDPKPGDVDLSLLPIVLLINLGAGATSVIADFKAKKPQLFRPEIVLDQIKHHKVKRITASPFFIKELSKYIIATNIPTTSVKQVFTGGAPVFPAEAEIFIHAFPHAEVEIVYGSTEAEPISSVNANELVQEKENILRKGLLVGKPYHKAEVKIIAVSDEIIEVNAEQELDLCKTNTNGEIIVAGPHVLREYFNNDNALKRNKIFIGEKVYHRTGDSGYLDENGKLFLSGRCSTLFLQNGTYVCPFLYENYFSTIKGIEMGTVIHREGKTSIVLELKKGTKKEMMEETFTSLPLHYDKIIFLKKMPRDPRHHSKIEYEKLRQLLI
jgi:acyl-CoA synthetase (AMP-forming)/AMP-acid ligase II